MVRLWFWQNPGSYGCFGIFCKRGRCHPECVLKEPARHRHHRSSDSPVFRDLVLTSLPLSLAMLVMLRYAAPLRPTAVIMMGSLAVAAITATALSLFHVIDATAMILMWNVGMAALFIGLGSIFGRRMFRWVAPRTLSTRD